MSVALRLQVQAKVSQGDEFTISQLQNEVAMAKAEAIAAKKQGNEAAEIITSLNLEISSLKRRVKEREKSDSAANKDANNPLNPLNMQDAADEEVDEMMRRGVHGAPFGMALQEDSDAKVALNRDIYTRRVKDNTIDRVISTPFQRWKMEQFLFVPDSAVDTAFDEQVKLEELLADATAELTSENFVNKRKKKLSALSKTVHGSSQSRGSTANSLPKMNLYSSAKLSPSKLDSEYFLDAEAPTWGSDPKFNRENLGRLNVWMSKDPPSNKKISKNSTSNGSSTGAGGSAMKTVKSLRHSTSTLMQSNSSFNNDGEHLNKHRSTEGSKVRFESSTDHAIKNNSVFV